MVPISVMAGFGLTELWEALFVAACLVTHQDFSGGESTVHTSINVTYGTYIHTNQMLTYMMTYC